MSDPGKPTGSMAKALRDGSMWAQNGAHTSGPFLVRAAEEIERLEARIAELSVYLLGGAVELERWVQAETQFPLAEDDPTWKIAQAMRKAATS